VEEVCAQDVAAFGRACLGERDQRDDLGLKLAEIPAVIAAEIQLL
jgi:hypothetical protein